MHELSQASGRTPAALTDGPWPGAIWPLTDARVGRRATGADAAPLPWQGPPSNERLHMLACFCSNAVASLCLPGRVVRDARAPSKHGCAENLSTTPFAAPRKDARSGGQRSDTKLHTAFLAGPAATKMQSLCPGKTLARRVLVYVWPRIAAT